MVRLLIPARWSRTLSDLEMTSIDYVKLANRVRDGLQATFTDLLAANPDGSFYTFAIWTDDSLPFANAVANTEEGLAATVRRDPVNIYVIPPWRLS